VHILGKILAAVVVLFCVANPVAAKDKPVVPDQLKP